MGLTSENVAQRYGVTRQEQDHAAVSFGKESANIFHLPLYNLENIWNTPWKDRASCLLCFCQKVESHKRAAAATAAGKFKDEIIPVSTKVHMQHEYPYIDIRQHTYTNILLQDVHLP